MAANLGTIYYTVEARTAALLSAEREVTQSMGSMTREMQGAERQAASLSTGMSKLASAIKVVVAASALREMAGLVQSYQEMSERVQMATSSQAEFEMVQRRLLDTANGTYRSLEEAQELYIRTADSLRSMGYSTAEALDITDSMSYAFVTNAASADRAAAASSAFSKSMNTGKVAADQWETITSAIPSVIDAIADASGKSAAEVRALGAAGKLSARDLSEGLRNSLDEVSAATANMANNLTDAGVRSRTALTQVLVALEEQTGGLQAFTDGIITAADAMLEFGMDAEKMETFLTSMQLAATSVAAVIAGRLIMALAASSKGLYDNAIAARAKAAADLQAAQSAAAQAASNLMQARAAEQAARGLSTHTAASKALAVAEAQAKIATDALSAAQSRLAATASIAARAAATLRTGLAFLGGPAGIVLLVAGAFLTLNSNARTAAGGTDLLTRSIDKLTASQRNFMRLELERAIQASKSAIDQHTEAMERNGRIARTAGDQRNEFIDARSRSGIDDERRKIEEYTRRLQQLGNMNIPAPTTPGSPGGGGADADAASQAQKRLQAMRDELALAQQVGAARERLRAIQQLGTEATQEEREEAERLATQIYDLEQAQRASQKAREDGEKSRQDELKGLQANTDLIAQLEEQMRQAEMTGRELAMRQAELSANEYATPEQVAQIREAAAALYDFQEAARVTAERAQAMSGMRQMVPEIAAEDQMMRELAAYQEMLAAKEISDQQYRDLKRASEIAYNEEMMRIEEERFRAQSRGNEFVMSSIDALGQASTDVLSGILSGTMNTQEAMQALGQAIFREAIGAIVQMGVQYVKSMIMGQTAQAAAAATAAVTGATVAAAWAPAAAMVSLATLGTNAAPAMAGITTTMGVAQGMSLAGGRQYGGPVGAGKMYRVNENGAPEVFNAANGRQYMMPNTRGEVVSNKDATGSGGGIQIDVRVTNSGAPKQATAQVSQVGDRQFVLSVMMEDMRSGSPTSYAQQHANTFGLRRAPR